VKEMTEILLSERVIDEATAKKVLSFVKNTDNAQNADSLAGISGKTINLGTKRLIETIRRKKSNLVASLDITDPERFFKILNGVGPYVAMVKTHIDIMEQFNSDFIRRLKEYAVKHDFLIFEDRKFADIGNTVRKQFREGLYRISDWADFVTVHGLPGPKILNGLFEDLNREVSGFLLAKMSADGNLLTETYSRNIFEMGKEYPQWVSGFIGFEESSEKIARMKQKMPAGSLLLMPGVNMDSEGDKLGQRYLSVAEAVKGGADLIIVGRGIYGADNPAEAAERYRDEGWKYLQERL
jgi:orotidine 5'-phosphate decarboxylase subfamily 1